MSGRRRLRAVAHLDLDCFYVQVEQRRNPSLRGKPTCVVQYNMYKGGAMIAVSYEARAFGITRAMRGEKAKELCPEVNLVRVPMANEKSDMQLYRDAGAEVIRAIEDHVDRVERASIDEAYVDITSQAMERLNSSSDSELLEGLRTSFIVGVAHTPTGWIGISKGSASETGMQSGRSKGDNGVTQKENNDFQTGHNNESTDQTNMNLRSEGAAMDKSRREVEDLSIFLKNEADRILAAAALVVQDLRATVFEKTKFTMSAGVGHNKMVAKLVSGMNKPKAQTLIHTSAIPNFFKKLPVKKLKGLGGKFGDYVCSELNVQFLGEVWDLDPNYLRAKLGGEKGIWLSRVARGLDDSEVKGRCLAKSIGCSKTFFGKKIATLEGAQEWIQSLANEVSTRVEKDREENNRIPQILTVSVSFQKGSSTERKKYPSDMSLVDKWNAKLDKRRSKSCQFHIGLSSVRASAKKALTQMLKEVQGSKRDFQPIVGLGLNARKFVDIRSEGSTIKKFFRAAPAKGVEEEKEKYDRDQNENSSSSRIQKRKNVPHYNQSSFKDFFKSRTASKKVRQPKSHFLHGSAAEEYIDGIDPKVLAELPADVVGDIKRHIKDQRRKRDSADR